jgi:hypothetical protein
MGSVYDLQLAAANKVQAALKLPLPESEDDIGVTGIFDPWDLFPCLFGSYDSAFDTMALAVLRNLDYQQYPRPRDLASNMFREILCTSELCEYGTSPRTCWATIEFKKILPEFIKSWEHYACVKWVGEEF